MRSTCLKVCIDERSLCFPLRETPLQEVLLGFMKIGFGAGKSKGFGGNVERSETISQAALPELQEECSLVGMGSDLDYAGQLTSIFPVREDWSQTVHVFRLLGHLPPLLKPYVQDALFLSFGNGIASVALSTLNISLLDVVELAPEMVDTARQVYTQENRNVLKYQGMMVHIEDARNFLLQTGRKFDIITSDATHPSKSRSWTLFTIEFYRGIQQNLTPDGVFLQRLPIHSMVIADYKAILRTYQSVFPNATLWYNGGGHILVLTTPSRLTKAELEDKLKTVSRQPEVLKDLGDVAHIERYWIMNSDQLQQFVGTGRLVTDNNAYFLPINTDMDQLTQMIQQAAVQFNP